MAQRGFDLRLTRIEFLARARAISHRGRRGKTLRGGSRWAAWGKGRNKATTTPGGKSIDGVLCYRTRRRALCTASRVERRARRSPCSSARTRTRTINFHLLPSVKRSRTSGVSSRARRPVRLPFAEGCTHASANAKHVYIYIYTIYARGIYVHVGLFTCVYARGIIHTYTRARGYLRDVCATASRRVASRLELTVARYRSFEAARGVALPLAAR